MQEGGLSNAFQSVRSRLVKESKLKTETERHTAILTVEKNLLSLLNDREVKQSLMVAPLKRNGLLAKRAKAARIKLDLVLNGFVNSNHYEPKLTNQIYPKLNVLHAEGIGAFPRGIDRHEARVKSVIANLEGSSRARTKFVNRLLARQGARNE